jgi:DNA-binding CsgD family transcriptional regulator
MVNEEAAENLAEVFTQAAIGESSWDDALGQLATATGAHSAQLIGLGGDFFNLQTNVDPAEHDLFAQANGHDPSVNSRVRIGMGLPELLVLDEAAFETDEDMRLHPEYGEAVRRTDTRHVCLTNLIRRTEEHVGLAVIRGARAGHIPAEERRLFQYAAIHARIAIRTHIALELRAMELTAAGLEQTGAAAFVLDRRGRLCAQSAGGEALIRRGDFTVQGNRLGLRQRGDRRLEHAIGVALSVETVVNRPPQSIIHHDAHGVAYMVEVLPLPSRRALPLDAGALVVARTPREMETTAARVAGLVYRLTPAEAAVAGLLSSGCSPQVIAERQGVSIGTVRNQIHSLFQKSGTCSQVELVAAVLARL